MASLMEELITTLSLEKEVYEMLLPIAEQKTQAIIDNNLVNLQKLTESEQIAIGKINGLEKKRTETIQNIGIVLGKKPEVLSVAALIELMEKQPKEQEQLKKLQKGLSEVLRKLNEVNGHNKNLIEQSLEMISYNMNLIQSTKVIPGNNYTKNAGQWNMTASQTGMFDAKQ